MTRPDEHARRVDDFEAEASRHASDKAEQQERRAFRLRLIALTLTAIAVSLASLALGRFLGGF